MTNHATRFAVAGIVCVLMSPDSHKCRAGLIYQSAAMGPPAVGVGHSIYEGQFLGVNFYLSTPATIDGVGGHMFGTGPIFGALVALTSLYDFPDSADLSSSDVLAHTLFTPPSPSADFIAAIGPTDVPAGYYAVVFGSGLFGTTSMSAGAPGGNPFNGAIEPLTIKYRPEIGWALDGGPGSGATEGLRFTVYGVPEPAGLISGVLSVTAIAFALRRRLR